MKTKIDKRVTVTPLFVRSQLLQMGYSLSEWGRRNGFQPRMVSHVVETWSGRNDDTLPFGTKTVQIIKGISQTIGVAIYRMTNYGIKTGRKPLQKRQKVNTNILPSLKCWLEQHAKNNGRSFSAEVSLILLEYATEYGFVPPEENQQNREIEENQIDLPFGPDTQTQPKPKLDDSVLIINR